MFAVWEYEGDIRQLITFLNVVKDLLSLALWGKQERIKGTEKAFPIHTLFHR